MSGGRKLKRDEGTLFPATAIPKAESSPVQRADHVLHSTTWTPLRTKVIGKPGFAADVCHLAMVRGETTASAAGSGEASSPATELP